MTQITRRMALRNSGGRRGGPLARLFIANAAARPRRVMDPGICPGRGRGVQEAVDEYQKQSGNTIDFSLIPFAPLNQKTVSRSPPASA